MSMSEKSIAFCVDNLLALKSSESNQEEEPTNVQFFDFNEIEELRLNLKVNLCSRELWLKFYNIGTEMIITKSGRRMFPAVRFKISGLKFDTIYSIFLELVPVDNRRYRFNHNKGCWEACHGKQLSVEHARQVLHPLSPASGHSWNNHGQIAFDKIKLTNMKRPLLRDHLSLTSMHKYMAKIHIMLSKDVVFGKDELLDMERTVSISFPETTFMAVTAYQNHEITKLKCACNPFATGLRSVKNSPTLNQTSHYSDRPLQVIYEKEHIYSSSINIPITSDILAKSHKMHSEDLQQSRVRKDEEQMNKKRRLPVANMLYKSNSKYNHRIKTSSDYEFLDLKTYSVTKYPIKFIIPPLHKNLMLDIKN